MAGSRNRDNARLNGRAALYIARHLAGGQLLVATDPAGHQLALELAAHATPEIRAEVRALLAPLVDHSVSAGQRAPAGW